MALINLDNRWSGFRYNIDEVLEGQFLIMAMTEATSLMNEVMPQLMEHTQAIVNELMKEWCQCEAGQAGQSAGSTWSAYCEQP